MNFLNDNKNKNKIYTADLLFDYLQVNLEPSILVSNIGHSWSEATESLKRAETLDDVDCIKITKKSFQFQDLIFLTAKSKMIITFQNILIVGGGQHGVGLGKIMIIT